MSNLFEQVAQPQDQSTANHASRRRVCPSCEGPKDKAAKYCWTCFNKLPRSPRKKLTIDRPKVAQPQDPSIRLIALTHGKVTIVNANRYEDAMAFNWYAVRGKRPGVWYARTSGWLKYSKIGQTSILLHEFLMGVEGGLIDHKDGDGLNNRTENLRPANHKDSSRNRGLRSDNTSGYIGVHARGNKWRASIKVETKIMYLGTFNNKLQAALIRDIFALKHYGEFVKLNFPELITKYHILLLEDVSQWNLGLSILL